jgi:DNA-binding PadR family transcriptional regulator
LPGKKASTASSAILRAIAESPHPLNKYGIYQQLEHERLASEPIIIYAVDALENKGLIRVVKTENNARGSKPSRYYDLTLEGLVAVIAELGSNTEQSKPQSPWHNPNEVLWKDIVVTEKQYELAARILEKYRNVQEVREAFSWPDQRLCFFDLWPEICTAGIRDFVIRSLIVDFRVWVSAVDKWEDISSWLSRMAFRSLIVPALVCSGPWDWYRFRGTEDAKRYLQAIRKNEMLRTLLVAHLEGLSETCKGYADHFLRRKGTLLDLAEWMRGKAIDLDSVSTK